MSNHYHRILFLTAIMPFILTACGSTLDKKPWTKGEVEISPGTFVEVDGRATSSEEGAPPISFRDLHLFGAKQKGTYWEEFELRVPWQGTNVHWKGNSNPLNLRSYEGKLYLITLDRVSKKDEVFFRYFAQEGVELREITLGLYPKAVAGQNMDFEPRVFGGIDRMRDSVQIARDLDPRDIYFQQSRTAYIWNHLATGEQFEQSRKKPQVRQSLLEDFIRTYKPIRLTQIVRDGAAQTNNPTPLKSASTNGATLK